MTDSTRKVHETVTPSQRLGYAKPIIEGQYSNHQVIDLTGAITTDVSRWKKQYLAEKQGEVSTAKVVLDSDKRRIQVLEK